MALPANKLVLEFLRNADQKIQESYIGSGDNKYFIFKENMEKRCSHKQEKKKVDIKGFKSGAIGVAIMLGGALATAALAAAFLTRPKGRASRREQQKHSTPPPLLNEAGSQSEQDEPTTGLQSILLDSSSNLTKNPSGATSEGESEHDSPLFVAAQIPILDRKAGFDINGRKTDVVHDADAYDQIVRSNRGLLHLGPKNMMYEPSTADEISKKSYVYVEKEEGLAGEPSDDRKMNIKKIGEREKIRTEEEETIEANIDQEPREWVKPDSAAAGFHAGEKEIEEIGGEAIRSNIKPTGDDFSFSGAIDSPRHKADGLEMQGIKHENLHAEEKQVAMPGRIQENNKQDEAKCIQEHLERNNNEEVAREIRTRGNSSIDNPLICHDHQVNSVAKLEAENMEIAQHLEEYVSIAPLPLVGNWKGDREDDVEKEVEMLFETSDALSKTSEDGEKEYDGEEDLSDEEVEATSLGTENSSIKSKEEEHEEPLVKVIDREVELEGKMKQDKLLTEGKDGINLGQVSAKYEKTFNRKYAALKDHLENSRRGRIIVWTLLVGPLLACSWVLGLQFVGVCLIAFFTIVFSTIYGGVMSIGIHRKICSGQTMRVATQERHLGSSLSLPK